MDYKKLFTFIFYLFFITGCSEIDNLSEIEVIRFEKEFYSSKDGELDALIKKYPYLFPNQFSDSVWLNKKNDSIELELYRKSSQVFSDFNFNSKKLKTIFSKAKSLEAFKYPTIVSLINKGNFEDRVIYADSLLFVSLNFYLGANYYNNLPNYISERMEISYISNDIAYKISEKFVNNLEDRTLLSNMITHGKILYINKLINPSEEEWIVFNTTKEKLVWAIENEFEIWSYFVEKELFYDTDLDLRSRFMSPAPYSKFNLDIDKKSPGGIGRWLGFKIVNSYMNHNQITVNQLLNIDHYTIFKNSKYKPVKK
jgi:hypothetical protein